MKINNNTRTSGYIRASQTRRIENFKNNINILHTDFMLPLTLRQSTINVRLYFHSERT